MAIEVYLYFNGNCREAIEFYSQVFGTEPSQIMTYGSVPPDPNFTLPEEAKNLVMHAYLNMDGSNVMFSDSFPGSPFVAGTNIHLTVINKDIEVVKALYHKLQEGGKIGMELQETFWSKCFGTLTDKFGISWQLSHDGGQAT
jgi:PhnB protein